MKSVVIDCPSCKKPSQIEITAEGQSVACPLCAKNLGTIVHFATIFDTCPLCTGRQFYLQKDFNRGLGCLIVLIGIILVPATFGLSLPVCALIDWLLYRRTQTMVVCYRCGAEYRGFPPPTHLKPYMHHIALKYDKYR